MNKKLPLLLSVLLIAGVGLAGCTQAEGASSSVTTQKVTKGNLILGLTSDGNVALPVTNLNFGVEGTVKKIYVANGDYVKAGDLLAELDDTDYQLAITTAQNNLDKANAAYEDAVRQHDYSLKSNEMNLQATKDKLAKPFDEYTYQTAITDAKTSLERKEKELADLEAEAAKSFDDYSYKLSITEAEITLSRRNAELKDAEATLADAKAKAYDDFDSYTYENAIANAKTTYERRAADYETAVNDYNDARENYLDVYGSGTDNEIESAKTKMDNAAKGVETAQRNLDDAKTSLDKAQTDYDRAKSTYDSGITDEQEKAIEDAQKKADTAKNSADDAQRSYDKAVTELQRAKDKNEEDTTTKLASARTAVTDAKTALEKAETNYERAKADYAEQLKTTQSTYELQAMNLTNEQSSTLSITNALLNIEEAKLKLKEAEHNQDKVKVYAPIDGQIINVGLKEGETAAARDTMPGMVFGTNSSSGDFVLCDVSQIYLTASITEGDIVGVELDQIVKVTVDSLGEEEFSGKVTSISNIPTTDSNGITTYTVTCKLDNTNMEIKDGMNALLNFIKKERNNVLMIPNKAVFIEDNKQYVNVVLPDGSYEKRAVTCGLSNGTQTEVADGLSEGETVVVGKVKV